MDHDTTRFPAYRSPGFAQTIRDVLVEVATMLFGNATFEPQLSPDVEAQELVGPHLAVLVHKRERFLTPDANGVVRDERWTAELNSFVERSFFWPATSSNDMHNRVDRRHLARLVDRIVADEQRRVATVGVSLPQTSRFGSSWAD